MRSRWTQILISCLASAMLVPAAQIASAQPTPKRALLALSKRDHMLVIVDPATLQVVARAPVGPDPHEVIASADGRKAYVSIYGGGAITRFR
jgi:DNA-binding beta-propeller fold protein YncE